MCNCLSSVNLLVLVLGMQLYCLEMKPKEGFQCLYCSVVFKRNLNVSHYIYLDDTGALKADIYYLFCFLFSSVFLLYTCVL